jgi:hypothetical protein
VICNGHGTAIFTGTALQFVAETFKIIAEEGRATRRHSQTILGGFRTARPGGVAAFNAYY